MPNSTATPLITFKQVRKHIAKRCLLDIDEFTILRSSCLFLSGNNGSGKTTLLKIISGLMAPDHAEIHYNGKRLLWPAARQHIQRDVIYLHQTPYIFDGSVTANIAYGLRRRGWSARQAKNRVERALRWAGLSHLATRNARALSGGEKQRVALTRAWVLEPHILLLDEPLTGLDYTARLQTISLIERLSTDGMGIVVTGHDVQTSMSIATEHLHLQQGKLVRFGEFKDVSFPIAQKAMQSTVDDTSSGTNDRHWLQGIF